MDAILREIMLPLAIGGLFGASLYLAGLADPDKIVGTLRFKDFHALRTIAVFILVGIAGTWVLGLTGQANMSLKPNTLVTVLLGGALLGIGFGLTGYCPGTGLACAAAGRFDALVTVLGMFAGAGAYIYVYPHVVPKLEKLADYGKQTLPQITGTRPLWWVAPIVIGGVLILWATKPRDRSKDADLPPEMR